MRETAQHCRLIVFRDSDLADDLEESAGCARNKLVTQKDPPRLKPFLWITVGMDGLLTLDLWDIMIELLLIGCETESTWNPRTNSSTF